MPSQASLAQQQYYAHSRNGFWPIMARLCDFSLQLSYPEKLLALQQHRLALWDVIHSCERRGSLDSRIQPASVVANDFVNFFQHHAQIAHIFFNGTCAEREYRKRALPTRAHPWWALTCTRLPSTSPAMASLTLAQKLEAWGEIVRCLV